jgi:hypothetical protein
MWQRGRVRSGARALLVAAMALAATIVPPPPDASGAPGRPGARRPPVDVFGDSVVLGAREDLTERVRDGGWKPRIVAAPGASIEQAATAITDRRRVTRTVVLVLGYSYFGNQVVLRREIESVMYALSLRGVRRAIWLNLREDRPERRDVNSALNAAAKRWDNLEIADWDRVSRDRARVFLPDGHHLRPAGGRLMGALIDSRLRAYRAGEPRPAPPRYRTRMRSVPAVEVWGGSDMDRVAASAPRFVARAPLVGIAATPSGDGYWLVRRNGAVRAFGDARYHGSAVPYRPRAPIVGISASPSGRGYWLVASDGGVFAFGDARFHGSTGAIRLVQPVVGMAATPNGRGYWLVAADGGVFSFGAARFHGSTGGIALTQPMVAIAASPDGRGYWLMSYDGGIFAFGTADFHGSGATTSRYWRFVSMGSTADGDGYWLLAANGEVVPFGSADEVGWRPSLTQLFVGLAPRPGGYWLLAQHKP